MAGLSVQPNQNANLTLANYTVAPSADGGYNFFFNGSPITREQYAKSGKPVPADPVRAAAGVTSAPSNPTGSSGPAKVNKSNDIAAQLAYLAAEDQKSATGGAAIDASLSKLNGQYDTETAQNEGDYKTNSDQNQNNRQVNHQTALVNAAQGRRGLFGTLASLGALNGSGIDLANEAVQHGANEDLAGADSNYGANQSTLDTSIKTYRTENDRRKQDAVDAANNAKTGLANDVARERASLYSNLVGDYSAQGDEGNAKAYTDKIVGLAPEIARTAVPSAGPSYSSAAYTPTSLANYIAGANSTQVAATPTNGSGIPGLVASPTKKRVLQPA